MGLGGYPDGFSSLHDDDDDGDDVVDVVDNDDDHGGACVSPHPHRVVALGVRVTSHVPIMTVMLMMLMMMMRMVMMMMMMMMMRMVMIIASPGKRWRRTVTIVRSLLLDSFGPIKII